MDLQRKLQWMAMIQLDFVFIKKMLQMEGDIRSNSSEDVSDASENNASVSDTTNYVNKRSPRQKTQ